MFEDILAQIFRTSDNKGSQQKLATSADPKAKKDEQRSGGKKGHAHQGQEGFFRSGRKLNNAEGSTIFGSGLVQVADITQLTPQVSAVDEHHSIFGNQEICQSEL